MNKQKAAEKKALYYKLFAFFHQEHNLILQNSEIQEIIHEVEKFQKENGQEQQGWIPVEERLPEIDQSVIATTFINGKYEVLREYAFIDKRNQWYWNDGINKVANKVTHWRPLPPPPNSKQ